MEVRPWLKAVPKNYRSIAAIGATIGSILIHGVIGKSPEEYELASTTVVATKNAISKTLEEKNLEDQIPPEDLKRMVRNRQAAEEDNKRNEQATKERASEGETLLKYIHDHYDTMDLKEAVWRLEYVFQGVSNSDDQEGRAVLKEKLSGMPVPQHRTDLDKFHDTFIPNGPKNDIKSSGIEFLAHHLDTNFLNCHGAVKTLVIALLTKNPKLRNSLYYQIFNNHIRLIVELDGSKHIFEWGKVVTFPDTITHNIRNVVIPVDVYYGLASGREEAALLQRIQYFGPRVNPDEVQIPEYTNSKIPQFNIKERLGQYKPPEIEDKKMLEELKKAHTELEKEKIKIIHSTKLVIPAETPEEKEAFQAFDQSVEIKCEKIMFGQCETPYKIIIKMDKISFVELKKVVENPLFKDTEVIFAGLKKLTPEIFDFLLEHCESNHFTFVDLEEITAEQMTKLLEMSGKIKRKVKSMNFYSLKFIKGNPPPIPVYFDVDGLLVSNEGTYEIAMKPKPEAPPSPPPILYHKINAKFHSLVDVAKETAIWLGHQQGSITFGYEANLSTSLAQEIAPFPDEITVLNPQAISLAKGLKKHKGQTTYKPATMDITMAEALKNLEGPLSIKHTAYSGSVMEILKKRSGAIIADKEGGANLGGPERISFLKAMAERGRDLELGFVTADESSYIKNHKGNLNIQSIIALDKNELRNIIADLATTEGTLTTDYITTAKGYYHKDDGENALEPLTHRTHPTVLSINTGYQELAGFKGFKGPLIIRATYVAKWTGLPQFDPKWKNLTEEDILTLSKNNASVTLHTAEDLDPKFSTLAPNVKIIKEEERKPD